MADVLYGVYGASGFGREVLPVAQDLLNIANVTSRLVFIDDGSVKGPVNGVDVYSYQEFVSQPEAHKRVVVAIADSGVRERIVERMTLDDVAEWDVIAANAVTLDNVNLGEGHLLCPFVTLTSNIIIGKSFHANIYSYVAHDCMIGDFVTFAPRVCCNGNVHIEDHAYIGTGAILKQGTPEKPLVIGRGAVVGMGAVVTKDVLPGQVVVGNPAKPLKK